MFEEQRRGVDCPCHTLLLSRSVLPGSSATRIRYGTPPWSIANEFLHLTQIGPRLRSSRLRTRSQCGISCRSDTIASQYKSVIRLEPFQLRIILSLIRLSCVD